ncbi:putative PLP-dependent enzyme possibly involved in cell wall biogenesis [Methanolobus tindarius DSM 2278]|uniref:Putative PLP-dependent enzyme possibly involved in cell wall biogenesis n=1 Tax=Methanolobus tindarius DSM 2278 TaxID=1090322 RepID=W9DP42_METTI|nr:DegT/DnrJ/EryC1/StrS family aminotransferase [Methanolobus tindarius]ETA66820.1 putative PLP-dependent enzyme possibly involved in cell wall biogenesis [Methanolobus tindarius DSM 2278]
MNMIPIAKPQLEEAEIEAVNNVLRSGIIAEGPRVAEFEQEFADYTGTEYAVAVNSGTAALHAALLAHGIGKGDEVITSSFSFIATANSILFTGAKPVFADIRADTFNLAPQLIEEKITASTKAIMPVHLYGHPADMEAMRDIAEDNDLILIEDACQAHGAIYNGKKVGSFGTGAFSFYPTKNMTTSEGGIITTNSKEIADRARMIRAHGSRQRYLHEMLGYNLRMTDISAAIGMVQLKRLPSYIKARQRNAKLLTDKLQGIEGIECPAVRNGCQHVFHQYTIRTRNRDQLSDYLKEKGIGSGIYYPIPIHKQPYYKELGYKDNLLVTEKASREVLSLPVHPAVTENDINTITNAIKLWSDEKC